MRVRRPQGFTLIELILVMALLVSATALTMPALSPFFVGRGLVEDGRSLLAMTRYARNEAISSGESMTIWIKPESNACGVAVESAYSDQGIHVNHGLSDRVMFEKDESIEIRFSPNGTIEGPDEIALIDVTGKSMVLSLNGTKTAFAIKEREDE